MFNYNEEMCHISIKKKKNSVDTTVYRQYT